MILRSRGEPTLQPKKKKATLSNLYVRPTLNLDHLQ